MESKIVHYEKGLAEYYNLDYDRAITSFNQQILEYPDFPEVFLFRGHSKFILGDKQGACLDWKKAQNLGNPEAGKFLIKFCG